MRYFSSTAKNKGRAAHNKNLAIANILDMRLCMDTNKYLLLVWNMENGCSISNSGRSVDYEETHSSSSSSDTSPLIR